MLQEHWLLPSEINFLQSIHPDFMAFGISAVSEDSALLVGRPYGGTAILFRKQLSNCIKHVSCTNPRITAAIIDVFIDDVFRPVLLASVYMPVSSPGHVDDEFEFTCGCIDALIVDCNVCGFLLAGDFNFALNSDRHKFVLGSLASHQPVLVDQRMLESDSFTYVSDVHNTTSWIDHIVMNDSLQCIVSKMAVGYDFVASDHRPLQFDVKVRVLACAEVQAAQQHVSVCDWAKCSDLNLVNYSAKVTSLLQSAIIPPLCCTKNCDEPSHILHIDEYLRCIYDCIYKSTKEHIPTKSCSSSHFCVAGWNDLVADKHLIAREGFLEWMSIGKPRLGPVYEMMKRTRAQFKLALRYCRSNEDMLKCNALANDYLTNNESFWSIIRKMSNDKMTVHSNKVGSAVGDEAIAQLWKSSFKELYSRHDNDNIVEKFANYCTDNNNLITVSEVTCAVNSLKSRKASGPDGV
jgi:hypothetical protein